MGYSFDPSGNVVGRHSYGAMQPTESIQLFDAFGAQIYDTEVTGIDEVGTSDPIGYKGQFGCYTDHEVSNPYNLVYCHHRYYSPYLGRWLTMDPWEAGTIGRGSQAGKGWTLRQRAISGEYTDQYLQWHPGGGHHGVDPYWKISSGPLGTLRFPSSGR